MDESLTSALGLETIMKAIKETQSSSVSFADRPRESSFEASSTEGRFGLPSIDALESKNRKRHAFLRPD